MSERTITLSLSESEHAALLSALLAYFDRPPNMTITEFAARLAAIARVIDKLRVGMVLPEQTPPAPAPATKASVDHFARDRKGNAPSNPPTGAALRPVEVVSREEKDLYCKVIFNESGLRGGSANCFDGALWQFIPASGKAQLWLAKSGNYLNIVGVRV